MLFRISQEKFLLSSTRGTESAKLDKNNKRALQDALLFDRVHPARLQTYLMQTTGTKKTDGR